MAVIVGHGPFAGRSAKSALDDASRFWSRLASRVVERPIWTADQDATTSVTTEASL